jgi:hypothetical protein
LTGHFKYKNIGAQDIVLKKRKKLLGLISRRLFIFLRASAVGFAFPMSPDAPITRPPISVAFLRASVSPW